MGEARRNDTPEQDWLGEIRKRVAGWLEALTGPAPVPVPVRVRRR